MNRRSANILDKAPVVLAGLILLFFAVVFLVNYLNDPYNLRARRRAAHAIARQLSGEIQHDVRFSNIQVRVFDVGDKGPLFIIGGVQSQADSDELRRMVASLHLPPSSVDWNVDIVTNETAHPN